MSPARLALLAQLASTLPLVGLIWIVQVVLYPQFARVGSTEFVAYHAAHSRLITFVVAPLMVVEIVGALALLGFEDATVPRGVAWLGAFLAASTWGITMLVSVPQHEVLARGFDAHAHALLVTTNWLRTVAWSLRGALLLWVMGRLLSAGSAVSLARP